jgi:hypothetical protein
MKRLLLGGGLLLVGGPTAVLAETTHIIRTDAPRQTILHFGASDAWSMQTIGLWTDTVAQQQVADWLFSMDTDADGQPRGIGLSLWRFNLGAGSSEQGRESQISRGTRTECFLQVKKAQNGEYDLSTATYDWSRQTGQRRFLHMAKERGVPHFLAFLNSPPVYFTQNGLATNTGRGGTLNLRDDSYDDFADFMATAMMQTRPAEADFPHNPSSLKPLKNGMFQARVGEAVPRAVDCDSLVSDASYLSLSSIRLCQTS